MASLGRGSGKACALSQFDAWPKVAPEPCSTRTMGTRVSTSMPAKESAQEDQDCMVLGWQAKCRLPTFDLLTRVYNCRSCTCESITNRSFAEHRVSKQGG